MKKLVRNLMVTVLVTVSLMSCDKVANLSSEPGVNEDVAQMMEGKFNYVENAPLTSFKAGEGKESELIFAIDGQSKLWVALDYLHVGDTPTWVLAGKNVATGTLVDTDGDGDNELYTNSNDGELYRYDSGTWTKLNGTGIKSLYSLPVTNNNGMLLVTAYSNSTLTLNTYDVATQTMTQITNEDNDVVDIKVADVNYNGLSDIFMTFSDGKCGIMLDGEFQFETTGTNTMEISANRIDGIMYATSFSKGTGDLYKMKYDDGGWERIGSLTKAFLGTTISYSEGTISTVFTTAENQKIYMMNVEGEWEVVGYDATRYADVNLQYNNEVLCKSSSHKLYMYNKNNKNWTSIGKNTMKVFTGYFSW